jgi:hypothetical protein
MKDDINVFYTISVFTGRYKPCGIRGECREKNCVTHVLTVTGDSGEELRITHNSIKIISHLSIVQIFCS